LLALSRPSLRRKKGSKNREKAKLVLPTCNANKEATRSTSTHRLSHDYAKSHGTVVIEDLKIGNMVKANRGLARGILDQGWGLLAKFLAYKLAREGGQLAEVYPAYSSQTCSACGCVDALSRKGEVFLCVHCGYREHADINASKSVEKPLETIGSACGEFLPPEGTSTKQESGTALKSSTTKLRPLGRGCLPNYQFTNPPPSTAGSASNFSIISSTLSRKLSRHPWVRLTMGHLPLFSGRPAR
jgi:IS605 OrfB family transposase